MKLHRLLGIFCLSFVLPVVGGEVSNRKMAWAHYTPWHSPFNSSLSALNYYNFTLQDSTGKQHLDWQQEILTAKKSGLDGFFVDLIADPKGGATVYVSMMGAMLKAAEGTDFQIGACLDAKTNVAQQVRELKKILDSYAKHPNYPHWNGKPVVATYTYTKWTPDELAAIRAGIKSEGYDIFLIGNIAVRFQKINEKKLLPYVEAADMIYPFELMEVNESSISDNNTGYRKLAQKCGKELMVTIYPGYYGGWLSGSNDFYQVHCGFDQAHRCFESVSSMNPQWLHYTTWNDLVETSMRPMVFTPANPLIIKAYSEHFKGVSLLNGKPEVVFAYHREEQPGTLLRIEAMTLPTLKDGQVELKGKLLDENGNSVEELPIKSLAGNTFDRTEWLIPTTTLGKHPILIPEFLVNGKKIRLPEVVLVAGWHQNGVTVKTAASKVIMPESSLKLKQEANGLIRVVGSYNSQVELKRVSLWRNDRPVAVVSPETEQKSLFNLRIKGAANITVTPLQGRIVSAVRFFEENHSRNFEWSASELKVSNANRWTDVALLAAGEPDMKFRFSIKGQEAVVISAAELMKRELIKYGQSIIRLANADGTMQNRSALKQKNGTFDFKLFGKTRSQDRWQLYFESVDGCSGWSIPIWSFADKRPPFSTKLLESSISLETPTNVTGWNGRSEYLTKEIPCRTPQVKGTEISPLSIRGGRWDFEGNGNDRYGDMSVDIPENMFGPGAVNEGLALRFTGKSNIKMRLRTYPAGSSTVDFLICPDRERKKKQGIITRIGWSSAINIFLLPNGNIEVIRNGNKKFKKEKVVSTVPIPDKVWSRIRVTCDEEFIRIYINDKITAEQAILPQRCYGNCTWYLGKGEGDAENFTGSLDALTVFGVAFPPGDINEPQFKKAELFAPLPTGKVPTADNATAISGKWIFPADIEERPRSNNDIQVSAVKLNKPVLAGDTLLLGPGANTIKKVNAAGVELVDNSIISLTLHRFERAKPVKAWYALLISIGNGNGKLINFNFGSEKSLMITEMMPKWKIKTGEIKVELPIKLQIAKRNGTLIFIVDGKVVFRTDDDPEHPFNTVSFQTSSPNRADAVAIQISPPVLCKLK